MAEAKKLTAKEQRTKDAEALEAAKTKFQAASEKFNDARGAVNKAKRTIATGDKKLATLDKKIQETLDAPSKAVEILLKKTEEMNAKTAALNSEKAPLVEQADGIDKKIEEKTSALETATEESKKELESLGITTKVTRAASSGTSSVRRAKNNFQYRLKLKGWKLNYNAAGRIESAENAGLVVDFGAENFTVKKGEAVVLDHAYGEGSLSELATTVKEHGEGDK